jgi:hypothetical protein
VRRRESRKLLVRGVSGQATRRSLVGLSEKSLSVFAFMSDRGGGGRRSNIMSALRYAGGRGGGQPDERRIAR